MHKRKKFIFKLQCINNLVIRHFTIVSLYCTYV